MKNRSRVLSLACVGVCTFCYSADRAIAADSIVFNSVGILDPNAPTSANPIATTTITIFDAASNNTSTGSFIGKNFAQFNTIVTNAFANNSGGVCNFGDPDANGVSTVLSGNNPNTTFGLGPNSPAAVNYGVSEANTMRFYRSDGNATGQAIDYNNNQGTILGSGANGGDYLGIQGNASFNLNFVNPLSDFGITLLPRNGSGTTNLSLSIHLSNGAVVSTSTESTVANVRNAAFYGVEAPAGLSIVEVDAIVSGSASRLDDMAFVVAPPVVAGASVYWTNSQATGSWASTNWSNNADGSGTAVSLPTNGSTGVTFTASSITTGAVSTVLGANQNISSLAVNTSASSVTIGGTNDLTIGLGGITVSTATPLTINTSGKVNLGNSQAWNAGTGSITVSSQVAGSNGLTILGAGTTLLSGPNTFSGGTVVQGGNLVLGNATALGGPTSKLQINAGSVDLKNFNTTLSTLFGNGGSITSTSAGVSTITISGTVGTAGGYLGTINDGATGTVALNVTSTGVFTIDNFANVSGLTGGNFSGGTTVAGGGVLNVGIASGGSTGISHSLGVGSVTLGSATTPVAKANFQTQSAAATTVATFPNAFFLIGNATISNIDGTNIIGGPISISGLNNTIGVALAAKPFELSGPLSGSGSLTLQGQNNAGGYVLIGSATAPVDNSGFTGTITANNTVGSNTNTSTGINSTNTTGVQIVAAQNVFLPNGTIAFTADLPVNAQGPMITGFNGSAVSFASGITAPQIGALSSSTGGAIALVTQPGESVNLTLGLNNSTGSSYAGSLYDGGSSTPGSLTKIGTNQQILTGSNSYVGGTNVAGGTLTFAAPLAFPNFTALTIGANASAGAANFGTGPKNTLFVSMLSVAGSTGAWTGKLDLANNDMVVQNGTLATLTNQVAKGFNNGKWNGSGGIVSTAAAGDTTHLHALGVIQNSADGTTTGTELYSAATSNAFDGATADAATDVLVKYTYYGDTNLDGIVNGTDYSRIDSAYLADKNTPGSKTGWYNGDFNYDGVINGSDYTLIDNAYNQQGALIASQLATPTAQVAGSASVPEPTSLGLLGIGTLGLISRRRRMSRK